MNQAGTQEQVSREARGWLDQVTVDQSVLGLCPGYTALVIAAEGLRPGPGDEATDALLSEAEAKARAALGGQGPEQLEPVAAWRLAFNPGARLAWRRIGAAG